MQQIIKYVIAVITLTATISCTDSDEASRALGASGYKNVKITGYNWFGCDKNDGWHTGFTATGQNETPVSGTVCSGIFKGATIRLD